MMIDVLCPYCKFVSVLGVRLKVSVCRQQQKYVSKSVLRNDYQQKDSLKISESDLVWKKIDLTKDFSSVFFIAIM